MTLPISLALVSLSSLVSCADGEPSVSTSSAPLTVLTHDCDVDSGYGLDSYSPGAGGLHIVGIYEARNGDAPWWADPACSACLDDSVCSGDIDQFEAACDREPKPHPGTVHVPLGISSLVLASYEPTNWTVTVDPSAKLEHVVISSYGESTAVVPEGVTVERADLGYAYEWLTDEELAQSCEDLNDPVYCEAVGESWYTERLNTSLLAQALVDGAEALTGDKLSTFHGCYSMSNIAFAHE